MDANTILGLFEEKKIQFVAYSGEELIKSLNKLEYIDMEDRRSQLFFNRIDFICMSNCLKIYVKNLVKHKEMVWAVFS